MATVSLTPGDREVEVSSNACLDSGRLVHVDIGQTGARIQYDRDIGREQDTRFNGLEFKPGCGNRARDAHWRLRGFSAAIAAFVESNQYPYQ